MYKLATGFSFKKILFPANQVFYLDKNCNFNYSELIPLTIQIAGDKLKGARLFEKEKSLSGYSE
ncbi:hypothetical protein BpHYR1_051442 [Brachionus plicatilis]|uniref:Uncharacterized protein n=1 Tax=Brachionus plicatilis TaxID=10195 RepID=A0A3M7SHU5_BRAPC|nr:hypothetical protein BpHYR1_051442 [Brachionus plicatilis]